MKKLQVVTFTAEGLSCSLKNAHDGKATLDVVLFRKTRSGAPIRYDVQIAIARSSVACILRALQEFGRHEKAAAEDVARLLGVTS